MRFFSTSLHSALLSLLLGASACGAQKSADEQGASQNVQLEPGQCHADADCASGQTCATSERSAARRSLLIAAPCLPGPFYVGCTTDAECGSGQICTTDKDPLPFTPVVGACQPLPPVDSVCSTACSDTSCPLGTRCEEDGHCRLIPCDDPEGSCPEGLACDPETAALGLTQDQISVPGGLTTKGAVLALQSSLVDLHRSGCLLLHCEEPGGVTCAPGYVCDSEQSSSLSVGCAVLDCHDWGQCSTESYICEPTSSNPRPGGMDAHGCVYNNCEEGFDCGAERVCDFSRPEADERGCSYVQCDEVGATPCREGYSCKPGSEHADFDGCGPTDCTEGFECAATSTCDPSALSADIRGCAPSDAIPVPSGVTPGEVVPSPTSTGPSQAPTGPAEGPAGGGGTSNASPSSGGTTSDGDLVGPLPDVRPDGEPSGGTCLNDVDCQTGFCVNQTCRSSLGQCE